jgi:hypothetical protein
MSSPQGGNGGSGGGLSKVGLDYLIGPGREDPVRIVPRAVKMRGINVLSGAPGIRFEIGEVRSSNLYESSSDWNICGLKGSRVAFIFADQNPLGHLSAVCDNECRRSGLQSLDF